MILPFQTVTRLTGLLFAALGLGLLIAPGVFAMVFALEPSVGADVMARRAGAILAALSLLYLTFRQVEPGPIRLGIARSTLGMMVGLALLGLLELMAGRVGIGILIPVATELVFLGLYLPHAKA